MKRPEMPLRHGQQLGARTGNYRAQIQHATNTQKQKVWPKCSQHRCSKKDDPAVWRGSESSQNDPTNAAFMA